MKRKKRIPFLFLCALSLSGIRFTGSASAESGGGLPLFSRPFAEGRWRHNFTGGGKTAEPAAFRLGAGTDGIRVTVYGKKRANRNAEFTSLRAGVTPFRQRRFTANFFYGSLRYNGLASRLRNPPGAGTATVYSPVRPTKSLFFGQGDASDKQTLAGEILAGNWRFAVCGEPEDSGPVWFSAGWSGKLPLYPAVSLSVTGFTGRQILPEKPSDSWFPQYHRDNAAEILHAGGEFAVQHKHFSASVFVSAAEGILRPDSGSLRADAALYGKYGRLSVFYNRTGEENVLLSGERPKMLEQAGFSPYFTFTLRKRFWFRVAAGAQVYTAQETDGNSVSAGQGVRFAGGFLTCSTLTSSLTVRLKAAGYGTERKIRAEGSLRCAAFCARRLILRAEGKAGWENRRPDPETVQTGFRTEYRFTLYRSLGILGETEKEDGEYEYTAGVYYTDRIPFFRMDMDLSAGLSAHTDERKFSGNVTVKIRID